MKQILNFLYLFSLLIGQNMVLRRLRTALCLSGVTDTPPPRFVLHAQEETSLCE